VGYLVITLPKNTAKPEGERIFENWLAFDKLKGKNRVAPFYVMV